MIREVLEWFEVTERMPDDDSTVLIEIDESIQGNAVWLGWFYDGTWYDVQGCDRKVKKWARMPTGEATA